MSTVAADHIGDLLDWAKHNGSLLYPEVEIYHDNLTGLSFRAANDIPKSTLLVECAYETTLSYLNAVQASAQFSLHSSNPFPAKFLNALSQDDANVIGYFFLVQQYLLEEKSFWWNYIRLLPQPNKPECLAVPILWPGSDQPFLDGTNAEPAIRKRKEIWEAEWSTAIALLRDDFDDWEKYTFTLYRWAAAIFGSRSFRPSLTVSPEVLDLSPGSQEGSLSEHITKDSFSILLPVLDIGNHNGREDVDWSHSLTSFRLLNKSTIPKESQIYNFYGSKSNSELLVAYGFLLPGVENDKVNLKVNLPHDIQRLRRSQVSHIFTSKQQADEEFMFSVGVNPKQSISSLCYFSDGLFDTTMCMVANPRELEWISKNLDYSPAGDPSVFQGPLARSAHQALVLLKTKLGSELARLQKTHPGIAQNHNQHLALDYRQRQEEVLNAALPLITKQLESTNLTSIDVAFAWLNSHYPVLYTELEALVSDDQEEPLPINWGVLTKDWDFTYLVTWVYLVLSLENSDPSSFKARHSRLSSWTLDMRDSGTSSDDHFFAEKSEIDTINLMVRFVAERFGHNDLWRDKTRNLASRIVKEEAIRGVQHHEESSEGTAILQDMLCIELW